MIKKPSDLNMGLIQSVNLRPASLAEKEHLVPPYRPNAGAKLHNGRAAPTQDDLDARIKEVTVPNETGYAILAGKMRGDKSAPRLMQFRRFWEGLDSMASYWDTSLDEYIAPGEGGDSMRDSPISPKTSPPPSPSKRRRTLADEERPATAENSETDGASEIQGTYRGHRMSNGANMPEQHRLDTVRAFLEPITWPFGFSIQPPRKPPRLKIGNLTVPARLSYAVWRIPKEREKAQGRWLEGPIMGVSCRNETGFEPDSIASTANVLQEIAALLALAQERAREGKVEAKPGEGKWWTTNPRWGGGVGGEVGEGRADEDSEPVKEGADQKPNEPTTAVEACGRKRCTSKKLTMLEIWKTLRSGIGYWDPKVIYEQIGKDACTETDQVGIAKRPKNLR